MNGKSKFFLLGFPALLLVACSSGPAYTNAPQSDAAVLEGPVVPTEGPENGNCSVVVVQVDGLSSNFTASRVGLNWHEFDGVKPLLLTADKHEFSLNISYSEAAGRASGSPSPEGSGEHGSIGGVGELKATTIANIFAPLEAGHVYRISADLRGEAVAVVLWDETKGSLTRTRVADWSFNCPRTHTGGTGPGDHFL
ncbi:MAG TPA: hypothetical protein VFE25_08580 [Opitutaceae bacterium]|jgi:hypothetical protein|nr:hypothetical protein [Opitutaceae bacterium]